MAAPITTYLPQESNLRKNSTSNHLSASKLPAQIAQHEVFTKKHTQQSPWKAFLMDKIKNRPDLDWFRNFFSCESGDPEDTMITLTDTINGTANSRLVTEPQILNDLLGSREPDIATRIITVYFKDATSINREAIGVLTMHYDINPLVLQEVISYEHLVRDMNIIDRIGGDRRPPNRLLPSDIDSSIKCIYFRVFDCPSEYEQMCGMFFGSNGMDNTEKQTILIWIQMYSTISRSEYVEPSSYDRLRNSMKSRLNSPNVLGFSSPYPWHATRIKFADSDNRQFAVPYGQDLLRDDHRRFLSLQRNGGIIPHLMNGVNYHLRAIHCHLDNLKKIQLSFEHMRDWQSTDRIVTNSPIQEILRDLDILIHDTKELEKLEETDQRNLLSLAQLNEALESKETAISVARLSKLAFIFIPLTFATSVFGMNLEKFGQGNVSFATFIGTAVALVALTILPFVSNICASLCPGPVTVCTIRLLEKSKVVGFWFWAFTFFHSSKRT